MPPDDRRLKQTEIPKISNRYQNVHRNEVNVQGNLQVDMENQNNQGKMEIPMNKKQI